MVASGRVRVVPGLVGAVQSTAAQLLQQRGLHDLPMALGWAATLSNTQP